VCGFADPVDEELLDRHDLVDRMVARAIHRPGVDGRAARAHRRLVFDEFLRMQVGTLRSASRPRSRGGHTVSGPPVAFLDQLRSPHRRSEHGDRRDHP
jgi:RecG-like helicase